MQTLKPWVRVVGNFILVVAAGLQQIHRPLVKFSGLFRVLSQFASLMPSKKFGVLLERQAIGRNMLGSQSEGRSQTSLPSFNGLAWDPEHQVEIHIGESCLPQNME